MQPRFQSLSVARRLVCRKTVQSEGSTTELGRDTTFQSEGSKDIAAEPQPSPPEAMASDYAAWGEKAEKKT